MQQDLTVSEAAKTAGTTPETVRYYERLGVLPPARRSANNYRSYGESDVRRLIFLRKGRDLGFSLDDLRQLLAVSDEPNRDCADVDRLTEAHLEAVENKIADLERLAIELRHLSHQCRGGRISECRIIEALSPDAEEPGK